ncbi:hypothetical protein IQ210_46360 [Streptomyces sp. 3R004]|nr:hypothetical protein [Streptomyces justiciae]MBE8478386.1 hypothetical protein [Streptomyces justiciae]
MAAVMPPPDSVRTPSYRSRRAEKSSAPVMVFSPEIVTRPGDLRSGKVSPRLRCTVKPSAAHTAAPSVPLPSGMDSVGSVPGRPITTSERWTSAERSTWKAPFCHAVVATAVAAAVCRDACGAASAGGGDDAEGHGAHGTGHEERAPARSVSAGRLSPVD